MIRRYNRYFDYLRIFKNRVPGQDILEISSIHLHPNRSKWACGFFGEIRLFINNDLAVFKSSLFPIYHLILSLNFKREEFIDGISRENQIKRYLRDLILIFRI